MSDFSVQALPNGDFAVVPILPFEAIDPLLEAWGRYYGESVVDTVGELPEGARSPDVHSLARAQRMAPGTRQEALARHLDRGGQARRALMGAAAGLRGILPAHFVDPVPCIESERVGRNAEQDPNYTAAVRAVQAAWLSLQRHDELQGTIVRVQYQVRGMTQADKVDVVDARRRAAAIEGDHDPPAPISLKRYRDELRMAKCWMHARLAA